MKSDTKICKFTNYRNWVIVNVLTAAGLMTNFHKVYSKWQILKNFSLGIAQFSCKKGLTMGMEACYYIQAVEKSVA